VRGYLSGKFRTDPALRSILALQGSFGRVVDAGSGYGHIGLALLELGRADSVLGFDSDARRVAVAAKAGGGRARFATGSLVDFEFPEADTILFVDSLHYLPIAEQDAVLSRAANAIVPGGRIVIREVDAGRSARGALTAAAERVASVFRRRKVEFGFRSAADLVQALSRLGLAVGKAAHVDWSMTNNVLTVATKSAAPAGTAGAPSGSRP
jgi:SAM-dependent methyltransferase